MPVYIRVRLSIYACVYVYMPVSKRTRTVETPRHTRAHTDTCVYVSMPFERVCLYPWVRVYVDADMRAYPYGRAHTHMCMRSLSPPSPSPSPPPPLPLPPPPPLPPPLPLPLSDF